MDPRLPSSALMAFVARAESDADLAARIAGCDHPDQLIALARELGLDVALKDLRQWSRELGSPWWPWHNRGSTFRRAFFDQNGSASES